MSIRIMLGAALCRARSKYNMTAAALAAVANVSTETIQGVELGTVRPAYRLLQVYADKFRIELAELCHEARRAWPDSVDIPKPQPRRPKPQQKEI